MIQERKKYEFTEIFCFESSRKGGGGGGAVEVSFTLSNPRFDVGISV